MRKKINCSWGVPYCCADGPQVAHMPLLQGSLGHTSARKHDLEPRGTGKPETHVRCSGLWLRSLACRIWKENGEWITHHKTMDTTYLQVIPGFLVLVTFLGGFRWLTTTRLGLTCPRKGKSGASTCCAGTSESHQRTLFILIFSPETQKN